MGFFKKLFGHLGFFKDEHRDGDGDGDGDDDDDVVVDDGREGTDVGGRKKYRETEKRSATGFNVSKTAVPTYRYVPPVVSECTPGAGGIQVSLSPSLPLCLKFEAIVSRLNGHILEPICFWSLLSIDSLLILLDFSYLCRNLCPIYCVGCHRFLVCFLL